MWQVAKGAKDSVTEVIRSGDLAGYTAEEGEARSSSLVVSAVALCSTARISSPLLKPMPKEIWLRGLAVCGATAGYASSILCGAIMCRGAAGLHAPKLTWSAQRRRALAGRGQAAHERLVSGPRAQQAMPCAESAAWRGALHSAIQLPVRSLPC